MGGGGTAQGLAERELLDRLGAGGRVEAVVVVERAVAGGRCEYVPYLSASWRRGYLPIGLFRGTGVRAWRDLGRLVRFLRHDLAYRGPVALHEEGDRRLERFRTVRPQPPPVGGGGAGDGGGGRDRRRRRGDGEARTTRRRRPGPFPALGGC